MAVSENFVGRNYWGLVQQDGPWRMTSQDYNNSINRLIAPGPGGSGSKSKRNDDVTISFKDRFSARGDVTVPDSRYAQFSIVNRRGRSYVPAPSPGGGRGTRGYDGNQKSKDIGDVQDFLDIEANAFGASLGSEFYDKPLYPKGGLFVTEGYLRDQAIKQLVAPQVKLDTFVQEALAEDFYDHMLGGVAPLGQIDVKAKRLGPNLLVSETIGPFDSEYNEHFIPSRTSLLEQAEDTKQHLQARQDYLLDNYNGQSAELAVEEYELDDQAAVGSLQ